MTLTKKATGENYVHRIRQWQVEHLVDSKAIIVPSTFLKFHYYRTQTFYQDRWNTKNTNPL